QDDFVQAVRNGDARDLKRILTRYSQLIQINRMTPDGQTALTQSCLDGNLEIVKVLIAHGANPEQTNRDGFLPFHVACFAGRSELIKFFMDCAR
ncbi:Ankyrin repeat-containing domain, partial [Trinorchestia longiramus]